ncbi:MAG: ferredoxin [Lysobacteraceae bacterium]|nr:MAG: ferredoxin [Xanthomonadaceae bacterium]
MSEEKGQSLYKAHAKIYPRETKGRFQFLRKLAVFVLLGLFYVSPWLQWAGRQAVLFDLPARRFHVFGLTFWPQDFILLALLLIIAAVSLFFFTALAGRLFCGYACPQTVWTEVFIWIEQRIEGNRNKRIRLDKSPWSWNKLWRKALKHSIWVLLALWTGFTFVGFFSPIRELAMRIFELSLGGWEWFWWLFYSFATWGNAGFLREQVCLYMCPYARFQSAMFDRDTLVITYDAQRGEKRGARKRGADPTAIGLGDCIDCQQCVQVCPTGIDIRDGLQYECIACAACVDICDDVMDKMQYPKGLIRYTTENAMNNKSVRVLRPRTLIYSVLWLALLTTFAWAVTNRTMLSFDVLRDRNALYRQVDQRVENIYQLKITNKSELPVPLTIRLDGLDGASVQTRPESVVAINGEVTTVVTSVSMSLQSAPRGGVPMQVVLETDTGETVVHESRFFGPIER